MPSKGSKSAIAFYWLVSDLLCYVFSKNANSWKTHCVKVTASLNVCHNFLVLMWVRGVCIFIYKWGCKQVNGNTISFFPASFEPYEKKKTFCIVLLTCENQSLYIKYFIVFRFDDIPRSNYLTLQFRQLVCLLVLFPVDIGRTSNVYKTYVCFLYVLRLWGHNHWCIQSQ